MALRPSSAILLSALQRPPETPAAADDLAVNDEREAAAEWDHTVHGGAAGHAGERAQLPGGGPAMQPVMTRGR
jgi:hypothetical protein